MHTLKRICANCGGDHSRHYVVTGSLNLYCDAAATSSFLDKSKFNVWVLDDSAFPNGRWTNKLQDINNPRPLLYKDAYDLWLELHCAGMKVEIRDVDWNKETIADHSSINNLRKTINRLQETIGDIEERRLRKLLMPRIEAHQCICGITRKDCIYHK